MREPGEMIRAYLNALERHNLTDIEHCFTSDATVASKTYGRLPVRRFYQTLIAETLSTNVSNIRLYRGETSGEWIARFAYRWHKRDSAPTDIELIDLFTLDPGTGLIRELKVVANG